MCICNVYVHMWYVMHMVHTYVCGAYVCATRACVVCDACACACNVYVHMWYVMHVWCIRMYVVHMGVLHVHV